MEQKKCVDDYTIKEMYENFSIFEEKYSNIINDTYSFRGIAGDNFYSKLKFVKFLKEYKKALEQMPYIHKYSEIMIDEILNSVSSVVIDVIDTDVKYITNLKKIIFNRDSWENEIFNSIINEFTSIALKDLKSEDECIEYKELDKARIEYISSKLRNIKNKENYDNKNGCNLYRVECYEALVKLFWEKIMLNLNFPNLTNLKSKLEIYGEKLISIEQALNVINNLDIEESKKDKTIEFLERTTLRMKLIGEDIKEPTLDAQNVMNRFITALHKVNEIPLELKKQMINNLIRSVKDVKYCELDLRFNGLYYAEEKLLKIRADLISSSNKIPKSIFHEFTHAAMTSRDKYGRVKRVGFVLPQGMEHCVGEALNEGATEFFAQKIYCKYETLEFEESYPALVNFTKDMINLYGIQVYLDAMINGTEKLEEYMRRDGKSFIEFRKLTDDFYKCVHMNREKSGYEIMKTDELVKEKYLAIGNFIEDIKKSRGLKYSDLQSEWKNSTYLFGETLENKINIKFLVSLKKLIYKLKRGNSANKKTLLLGTNGFHN